MLIQHIKELYDYRNLIWVLAWVEFKQRYKNSVLGYFWSLLEPLFMFAILFIVFSNLMQAMSNITSSSSSRVSSCGVFLPGQQQPVSWQLPENNHW